MRVTRFRWSVVVVVLAALGGVERAEAQDVDLSGTWVFEVQTDAGSGTPTVTLVQEGDELTGQYSSDLLGEAEVEGSVEGSEFTFSIRVEADGTPVTLTYEGTVESDGELSGTVDLGGFGSGSFTARRDDV